MSVILSWLIIIASIFFLAAMSIATWVRLPRGNLGSAPIRYSANMTKGLRSGKTSGKIFYWLLPIFVLLFSNWLAGLFWLVACIIGVTAFVPRYNAALARATPES